MQIVDHHTERLIGTVDESRAHSAVHTGAIYLHRGQSFEVISLDLAERQARVVDADGGEYTQARSSTDIRVLRVEERRPVGAATLHLGEVEVSTQVTGYQLRESRSRKILGNETLDLPEQRLVTRAFWYTVDSALVSDASADIAGTLHAAEHAAIGLLPLFTICDRWDVGGVSTAHHADTGAPTIFVYSTSLISVSMILASGLSFLGLGVKPPEPEWGLMLNTLRTAIYVNPMVAALPGLAIFIVSISFNLFSDGLRSAMEVKS